MLVCTRLRLRFRTRSWESWWAWLAWMTCTTSARHRTRLIQSSRYVNCLIRFPPLSNADRLSPRSWTRLLLCVCWTLTCQTIQTTDGRSVLMGIRLNLRKSHADNSYWSVLTCIVHILRSEKISRALLSFWFQRSWRRSQCCSTMETRIWSAIWMALPTCSRYDDNWPNFAFESVLIL